MSTIIGGENEATPAGAESIFSSRKMKWMQQGAYYKRIYMSHQRLKSKNSSNRKKR
jgi:hypothetical protein